MIFWELKKIFKSKAGIIVLAMFILLSISMIFVKPVLEIENYSRNDKYELIKDTRPEKEIAQEKLNKKISQLKEMSKIDGKDSFSNKIRELSIEKLKSIKSTDYKDVSFFKVYNHRASHPLMGVIIVMIIVLIFSNIYTDEIVSGVDNMILSSKNKFSVLNSKLVLSIVLPILLYGLYLGIQYIVTIMQYGMPVNGGLEAFRIIDAGSLLNGNFTIAGYIVLKILIMTTIFISISVFASLFSFTTNNSLSSISGIIIFIVFGKICTVMSFLPGALLQVLNNINYVNIIFMPEQFIGMYGGEVNIIGKNIEIISLCNVLLVAILLIGISFCLYRFKKINK